MSSEKENSNSGTSDHRRSTKPIMEKRRRARINASLAELKSLLLEVMRREGSRHSKMEKADILEMTVRHLRQIQKQNFAAAFATDPSILNKYMSGFNECSAEVSRYLNTIDGVDPDIRARLLNHLANCVQGVSETSISAISPASHGHSSSATVAHVRPIQSQQVNIAPKPQVHNEINNNSIPAVAQSNSQNPVSLVGGVPVLPGKTPNGELAFVIPNNVLANGQLPSYVIPVYTGAVNNNSGLPVSPVKTPVSPTVNINQPKSESPKLKIPHISFPSDPPVQMSPRPENQKLNNEINNNSLANKSDQDDMWRPW